MIVIAEDSVRFAHSGPSQRFLRGLRPLVSVGPFPLHMSAGGHASAITAIHPPDPIATNKGLTSSQPLICCYMILLRCDVIVIVFH